MLISLLDALDDTAAALISAGDSSAEEQLWEATASGQPEHRRAASAAALGSWFVLVFFTPDRLTAL